MASLTIRLLYCKFGTECARERILKIGKYLMEIETNLVLYFIVYKVMIRPINRPAHLKRFATHCELLMSVFEY